MRLLRRRRDELRPHNDRRRRRRLIPNGNRVACDPADGGCGRHCGIYDRDSRNLDQKSQSHPLHSIRKSARGELVDSISPPPVDFDGGINKASE